MDQDVQEQGQEQGQDQGQRRDQDRGLSKVASFEFVLFIRSYSARRLIPRYKAVAETSPSFTLSPL